MLARIKGVLVIIVVKMYMRAVSIPGDGVALSLVQVIVHGRITHETKVGVFPENHGFQCR